jgi:hypothetical protein
MTRNSNNPKKKKVKMKVSKYTPTSTLLPGSSSSQSTRKETMHSTKLKHIGSRFSVNHRVLKSEVNLSTVTNISEKGHPMGWDKIADTNGWDPGYVESFLEKDALPPATDPELSEQTKGKGVSYMTLSTTSNH